MFKKIFSIFAALTLSVGLFAKTSVITYTAKEKLPETTNANTAGLHINAFYAADSTQLTVTHTFNEGVGTITLDGEVAIIGEQAFCECSSLQSVTLPEGLLTIGVEAFYECKSLQSITLPAGLTTIEKNAFCGCSGLTSITIPNSVTTIGPRAFYYCYSLQSVTLPENLTTIRESVFCGCAFTSINLPASVTTLGGNAFGECSSLQSVTLPEGLLTIGETAFVLTGLTSITIPAGVTEIGMGAFYECAGLTSVTFLGNACQNNIGEIAFDGVGNPDPALLTLHGTWAKENLPDEDGNWYGGKFTLAPPAKTSTITYTAEEKLPETTDAGQTFALHLNAFYAADSTQLTVTHTFDEAEGVGTITLNGEVAIIGDRAFYGTSIASITIPEGVTTMGENTFYSCDSLKTISLPTSLTTFGGYVFYDCTALTSITIPANVTNTGKATFIDCSALTSVTLPEGLTTIGDESFSGCSSLQSITIPESVTMIEEYAFCSCSSLQSITIPAGVTTIEDYVFYECTSLTFITIPSSVTKIGEAAFASTGLTSVTIPASVTELGAAAFGLCASLASVTFESNACQDAISEMAFMSVGDPDPALLTLPDSWTGTVPDEDGNWYGGKFELSEVPTALPTLFGDGVKGNKFLYNGQVIIRKNNKTYNTLGQEVR